ncbi:MAG: glycosyltransferase [Candidatus Aureabacteria bacterium]|nr:glycosyltransferase [Candidatus Auribacterota bacterium]
MSAAADSVTVYIPCHNAEGFLGGCVRSLLEQTLPPAEILVVNDGSTDRTREIAAGLPVRLVDLDGHPGLAEARNAGIREARGEFVASIDVDCLADPRWLERLLSALRETGAAGAGGKLLEGIRATLGDRWRAAHMRQDWGDARIANPPFLFGCNTLFRKDVLEQVGLYDPAFRTNGEDLNLSHRLMAQGRALVYEPAAVVTHLKRDTTLSVLDADWRWGYRSIGETMKYERTSHLVYHNFVNARYRARQDFRAGRYPLLLLDLLLLLRHTRLDLRQAREKGLLRRG